jgi:acetyl esterase/lipase
MRQVRRAGFGRRWRPNRTGVVLVAGTVLATLVTGGRGGTAAAVTFEDVRYSTTPTGAPIFLDVYRPVGAGRFPAVLVLHGGGWHAGTKDALSGEAEALASAGFVAFSADYRMACEPADPPPKVDPSLCGYTGMDPVVDVRNAIRFIRSHAAEYGVIPGAVGVLGSSAGAHLAYMLAVTGPVEGRADAVVGWSGPTDFRLCHDGARDSCDIIARYVGCEFDACKSTWATLSPARRVDPDAAAALIVNSTDEVISRENADLLAAAYQANGAPWEELILEGTLHARAYGSLVWDASVAFLAAHLST